MTLPAFMTALVAAFAPAHLATELWIEPKGDDFLMPDVPADRPLEVGETVEVDDIFAPERCFVHAVNPAWVTPSGRRWLRVGWFEDDGFLSAIDVWEDQVIRAEDGVAAATEAATA